MTDWRHGGSGRLRGVDEERLDIGDSGRVDGALEVLSGVLRHGGGLQRRQCLLVASWGGAGDVAADLVGNRERLTESLGRRRRVRSISCADRKNGNRFEMCARALGDSSAAIKRDMVQIMRQYSGDTTLLFHWRSCLLYDSQIHRKRVEMYRVLLQRPEERLVDGRAPCARA